LRVGSDIIKERAERLRKIASECANKFINDFLGQSLDVLFEAKYAGAPLFWQGYTHNYIPVLAKSSSNLNNQILCCRLEKLNAGYVIAKLP
jgi:threonylcarbamoyladenosine tRNA methylthiotransferase MtaB